MSIDFCHAAFVHFEADKKKLFTRNPKALLSDSGKLTVVQL